MLSTAEQVAAWKRANADRFMVCCPISPTMTKEACQSRRTRLNYQKDIWTRKREWKDTGWNASWMGMANDHGCATCTAWRGE